MPVEGCRRASTRGDRLSTGDGLGLDHLCAATQNDAAEGTDGRSSPVMISSTRYIRSAYSFDSTVFSVGSGRWRLQFAVKLGIASGQQLQLRLTN